MAYLTEDVGPVRGLEKGWYFQVRDASDPGLSFVFEGGYNRDGGSLAAHEALFQTLITMIDSDPGLVLFFASRTWAGNQEITP